MNYNSYMKKEVENFLFLEIKRDLTLNLKESPVLRAGEYPIFSEDMIELAQSNKDALPVKSMLDGMIYMIACDPEFKYNNEYIAVLSKISEVQSYIVMKIEESMDTNMKKSLIYATALSILKPDRQNLMNRIYILIRLKERTGNNFIDEEILKSLEAIMEQYPEYAAPNLYLGQYYLDKDMDKAKVYLRKALEDPKTYDEAARLLERIGLTEEYDKAVELIKAGNSYEALKIIIPYIEENPNDLDAKYYAAVAYRQTENYHKALMYLQELLEFGETLELYSEIGINLAALQEFEAAIDYFKKALKIMPSDSGVMCNIAVCQLNLGEEEKAKETFSLATRINPKDEIAREWLERLKEE